MSVKAHSIFKRSEENLFFEFPISFADAALGTTIEVPTIDGGKAKVKIPAGTQNGKQFRLKSKGMPMMRNKNYGDLYIFVSIRPHNIFKRSEENLFFEFPISLADAALGTTVEVPTIDGGKAKVKIPPGTQNGKQFRLKGKGMPLMRNKDYGDLYIQAVTEVPAYLTKEQKNLLEQFKKLEDSKSNPIMKDFYEKAKKFWKN